MGLLAVNGIAFPLSCVLKARPVKDKTHSYLFESVETGGRWKATQPCQLRKNFSNNKFTSFSLRANEATSHAAECSPSEIWKFSSFAPCDDTESDPRAVKFHFKTSYKAKTERLFMNMGRDTPLSYFSINHEKASKKKTAS